MTKSVATTRAQAVAAGLKRYYTGKPCKHGHFSERLASSADCIECGRSRQRVGTHKVNRLRKRASNLKARYGISLSDFIERVEKQAGRCAICRNLAKRLVVDHCHSTQEVRDLLCQKCNNILGLADDQIEILQSSIDYLVKHS